MTVLWNGGKFPVVKGFITLAPGTGNKIYNIDSYKFGHTLSASFVQQTCIKHR